MLVFGVARDVDKIVLESSILNLNYKGIKSYKDEDRKEVRRRINIPGG